MARTCLLVCRSLMRFSVPVHNNMSTVCRCVYRMSILCSGTCVTSSPQTYHTIRSSEVVRCTRPNSERRKEQQTCSRLTSSYLCSYSFIPLSALCPHFLSFCSLHRILVTIVTYTEYKYSCHIHRCIFVLVLLIGTTRFAPRVAYAGR